MTEIASFRRHSLHIGRVQTFGLAGQRAASPGKPIFMAGASARWPRAIIALAGSLSLEIVAEGIEKLSEKAVLESLGCTDGQGYLFAKPLSAHDVSAWIETQALKPKR